MKGDQPGQDELADLARTGRRELERLDRADDRQRWAAIEARLDATIDAGPGHDARQWRPTMTWWPLTAVAAVALVVGLALGGALPSASDAPPTTLATIELAPLRDDASPAVAALQQGTDGRTIAVDLVDLPTTDGFHEVWLLNPGTGALVSLGPVRADGTYVIPATVDLVEFPVLDVSVEPHDGDPTHSGDSLLRGDVTWVG